MQVIPFRPAARLARNLFIEYLTGGSQRNRTGKTEVIMLRIAPIGSHQAGPELKRALKDAHLKLEEAPNFLRVLANSLAALRAYKFVEMALVHGQLTPRQREQIALAVAEINGSSYSLSAHYDAGKSLGLTHAEMQLARQASAAAPQADAMLRFTQAVVLQRGEISDDDFCALRHAGFTDPQIIEIVANISLNIFANYFNSIAQTEVDFSLLQPGTDVPGGGIPSAQKPARRARAKSAEPQVKGKET